MQIKVQTQGYIYAFLTIVIWSGWAIVTRLGVTTHSMTPLDLAFMRYLPAGLLMLPIAIKHRKYITRYNYKAIIMMALNIGVLYFMLMAIALKTATAGHSIITPCLLTLIVAVGSYFMFTEKFSSIRLFGYALIIIGILYKIFVVSGGAEREDLLFIIAAFCYSSYTLSARKHKMPPLVNTAFVQVASLLLLLPIYTIYQIVEPHEVSLNGAVQQIFYQAILTSIVSLVMYNKAINCIGASRTASFAALLPVMVTLGAMPILNEYPTVYDWVFVAFMSGGVFFASGVLGKRRRRADKEPPLAV